MKKLIIKRVSVVWKERKERKKHGTKIKPIQHLNVPNKPTNQQTNQITKKIKSYSLRNKNKKISRWRRKTCVLYLCVGIFLFYFFTFFILKFIFLKTFYFRYIQLSEEEDDKSICCVRLLCPVRSASVLSFFLPSVNYFRRECMFNKLL